MKDRSINLTVITATWSRPKHLAHCLAQFAGQSLNGLSAEHLVVSDGPDPRAEFLANLYGARFHSRAETGGRFGVAAKDDGIALAHGEYVCFWDDDNLYERYALVALAAAASGVDIGIVQCRHVSLRRRNRSVIPTEWRGEFRPGQIDTMCVCVRRELACQEKWNRPGRFDQTDAQWLRRLAKHDPSVRFVPIVVGEHL